MNCWTLHKYWKTLKESWVAAIICILFASFMILWSSCLQELVYSVDQEYKPGLPARYLSPGHFSPQSLIYFFLFFPRSFKQGWGPRGLFILHPTTKNAFPKGILHQVNNAYPFEWGCLHICRHLVMYVPWCTYLFLCRARWVYEKTEAVCSLCMQWMHGIPHDKEEAEGSFCLRWIKVASSPTYILVPRKSSCALFRWSMAGLIMEALLVDKLSSHR